MGEGYKDSLRLSFDRKLKLEFHGTRVTSEVGLLATRQLDEVLGLMRLTGFEISDNRTGRKDRLSSIWSVPSSRPMVIRKVPPTTAILNARVITRCSVSINIAISS